MSNRIPGTRFRIPNKPIILDAKSPLFGAFQKFRKMKISSHLGKSSCLLFVISLLTYTSVSAQTEIVQFDSEPNATVKLDGNLSQGETMADLRWAWSSQNACFVITQKDKFTGHHVLFQTEIPPRSEMTIRVIPTDENSNFSLYAYSGGGGDLVPNLSRCVSCEADFKWDMNHRGKTQDHTRSVQLRAVNNPFPVTIGVVGAHGLDSGDFTLEVSLKGGEPPKEQTQEQLPIYQAVSEKGKALVYQGDLSEGKLLHDLSWAWDSQNACFPSTQQDQYQGHHQLYVTEIAAHSTLTITLAPDDPTQQLSLYAYSFGGDLRLVPNLSSCVTCEASHLSRRGLDEHLRQVELRAVNRPYRVVIGVAGVNGVSSGTYKLQLDMK